MKRKRYSVEQIVAVLKQVELGLPPLGNIPPQIFVRKNGRFNESIKAED